MKKENLSLSVSIITLNEENNIERCLKSISNIASEIVIVDSGSTDRTVEIAESFGVKVFVEKWQGYIIQKNIALKKCTKSWVLCLDADEEVSQELKTSIKEAIKKDNKDGYYINRRSFYLGKLLKYSWQPDNMLRLVRRQSNPCWGGYEPHDKLFVIGSTGVLKGDLIHYSYRNIDDHVKGLTKYAYLVAQSYDKMGKRSHLYNFIFNPFFAFFKKYIIRAGFLDGFRGFLIAILSFFYVFLKYSYLWEIVKDKEGRK